MKVAAPKAATLPASKLHAKDIMTPDVISVSPATPVHDIAKLMVDRRVSGLPVVDESGALLGMVSESDLLHRGELATERHRSFWLGVFTDADQLASEYAKAHGRKASDVMTRHVVVVAEKSDLREVADTLEKHNVKRVPVTRNGKLVGIITRSDLVRALTLAGTGETLVPETDADIQKLILDTMRAASWLVSSYVSVQVKDGTAELWGIVPTPDQHAALRVMVEGVPGVRSVTDHLRVTRIVGAAE